jgi:nucleoside-triphosphatase
MQGSQQSSILVITGPAGSRKTALCLRIADLAQQHGLSVRGVVSPPRMLGNQKVGIDVLDLSNGERRALAELRTQTEGPATRRWHFRTDALEWGMGVLNRSLPTDLLMIDELGPLELLRGTGWAAALGLLHSARYRWAIVVVRPALVHRFVEMVPTVQITIVEVTPDRQDVLLEDMARRWEK